MADTYITCDLGRIQDFTVISVVQVKFYDAKLVVGNVPEISYDPRDVIPVFEIPHLERYQVRYREALHRLDEINDMPQLFICDREIIMDATGVGDAVLEMAEEMSLDVTPIVITGGDTARSDNGKYYVPRKELIDALIVAYQSRRIRVSPGIDKELTEQLDTEMMNLQIKRNPTTAKETYEAMIDAKHDDMAMSIAMGIWKGMQDWRREQIYQENRPKKGRSRNVDWANVGLRDG